MYYSTTAPKVPTANICISKSRLKVYNKAGELPTYYLQGGTEFQIELSNPTTDVILAKIILNGKAISQGGLVLNPGQRVFLERYLDVAQKFKFDTYEVSNSSEMQEAIVNNGDLKVEFYQEQEPIRYQNFSKPDFTYGPGLNWYNTSNLIGSATNSTSNLYCNIADFNVAGSATNSTSNLYGTSSLGLTDFNVAGLAKPRLKKSKLIETGRVEMGSESDQQFQSVNKSFQHLPFHTIEYKLLPISQKVNTIEDVNVKVYCTQCGSKLGKTDRFCSSCGNKR